MGLSINQNIAAVNAYHNLSNTQNDLAKSLEKLSSGFRINRAADDAAGLAISEGLRSQIGGLKVAVRNAQDGTSVVQTAEGALNESTSILQRMRDLSVQASNTGGLSAAAKGNIQLEVGQLNSELTRIASTTQFNGTKLLDGTYQGTFQVGANVGETIQVKVGGGMGAAALGTSGVDVTKAGVAVGDTIMATGATLASTATYTTAALNLLGTVTVNGKSVNLSTATDSASITAALTTAGAGATATWATGTAITFTSTTSAAATDITSSIAGTAAAGTTKIAAAGDVVQSGASAAIMAIDAAIKTVSTTRADLGAVQNRFDHTVKNLNVAVENLSASESRIRDTDMASEMVNFTRSQILSQAGTAMLAQANKIPQGVLSLLQ
ncbi:MAG: flagellin [Cellulomonas sp.]|uniref:flagellin N-terminal helical domain-containing protein n=1 Tax=Cellulomonas sp. TaxID=40001 RepID=UPI00185C0FE4|nr:flagellin [Cellulomonas sp.]NMM31146.1 flagellin [Cellulomonas sp.]